MMGNFLYKWLNKFLSGNTINKRNLFAVPHYILKFSIISSNNYFLISSNNLIRYGNLTVF